MDNRFDKLELKLDKLDERLDGVDKTLIRQEGNLAEHMRRSDMLEQKLIPVESHVSRITWAIRGIFWFCSILGSIAATALILKQLGAF